MTISAYSWGHLVLAAVQALVWSSNNTSASAVRAIALLLVATSVYDNGLIGLGAALGEGPLLTSLSTVRFYTHWAFVPFLLVPATTFLLRANVLRSQGWLAATWAVAAVLSVVEVQEGFFSEEGLVLEPMEFRGMLRMVSASEKGLPVVTIAVNLSLLAVGLRLRRDTAILFAGSLAALVGNAVPSSLVGPLLGCLGEALLYYSIIHKDKLFFSAPEEEVVMKKKDR
eukprot:CAMPEP_0198657870 /NCGR_PEP_ID=MMETSP1467-20131203/20453_1 /TAXON_ID=1462469 /ORGANISM="unid. sp., Strain CCMP2135" /LENGTH=226 /DNA_ID=CAMNT_0044394099 /DNA_START=14 /DNA_END=694 /DNA_ORIENTATION=+